LEIVVDGSVAELPDLISHPHRVAWLDKSASTWRPFSAGQWRVLGRLAMEQDILFSRIDVPEHLSEGDLVAVCDAGAYDISMAFSFGRG
jgi:diaminopimelate decarboxylase